VFLWGRKGDKPMRKIQIGVMGSMADSKLKKPLKNKARKLGAEIAKKEAILIFGYEGDFNSLSEIAARSAEKHGGQTIAFLWGNNREIVKDLHSITVSTGQIRGGGREFPLVLSCDVLICIGGGSGTLTEIAMAYQADIPVVVLEKTGGWSQKLANQFLDNRERFKIIGVKGEKAAVNKAIELTNKLL